VIVDIEALYQATISPNRATTSLLNGVVCTFAIEPGIALVDRDVLHAVVQELRHARAIPRKYFRAHLNGATYTFVAITLEHAQHMLATSSVDPNPDRDGEELEWCEMTPDEIARCNPSGDDNVKRPLNLYPLGMWFSSEY
jgi:hypothetical protein